MREIKFRGKFVYTNTQTGQFDWAYGDLIHGTEKHKIICEDGSQYDVLSSTVGQFTGLHDKNGKEIYEGDIVEYTNTSIRGRGYKPQEYTKRGYIGYLKQEAGYVLVLPKSDIRIGERHISSNCLNVIGNIHDNPELLKGGKQ